MKDLEDSLALPMILEDYLEKIPQDGQEAKDVLDIIRHSHFDKNFSSHWKPVRVELVKNKHLDQEYEDKKQDLLIRGRQPQELREGRGFYVENNVASLEAVTAVGLQTHESDYNPLGYSRVGVYLCKHADICLQHALIKHSGSPVMRMIVFKYIIGRLTRAIPRTATAQEFIEPTQGHDCHMSALPVSPSDSLQVQFDRSQVYNYEISKLLQPSRRPRQVIPYAVVTFTENGEHNTAVDAKPTPKEKLQGNPRLQEIIKAINSKPDPTQQKTGAGLVQGMPWGGAGARGGSLQALSSTLGTPSGGVPGMPPGSMAAAATGAPITLNGAMKAASPNGLMSNNGLLAMKPPISAQENHQIKMIVNRINARLGAEEKALKVAMSVGSLPGSSHPAHLAAHGLVTPMSPDPDMFDMHMPPHVSSGYSPPPQSGALRCMTPSPRTFSPQRPGFSPPRMGVSPQRGGYPTQRQPSMPRSHLPRNQSPGRGSGHATHSMSRRGGPPFDNPQYPTEYPMEGNFYNEFRNAMVQDSFYDDDMSGIMDDTGYQSHHPYHGQTHSQNTRGFGNQRGARRPQNHSNMFSQNYF